tara:strand:- start:43 stop:420 length:378 start_codon:yes stop_codon:yes gene_type:complete
MNSFKKLIVILLIFVSQNANANWVFFYESQMFDAKLLLTSVQQKKQVTLALIAINYKEKQYFDGVSSQVIFLEHICGETNPTIIEEKFYKGLLKEANEISLDNGASKFEKYAKKTFPNLIKQICI